MRKRELDENELAEARRLKAIYRRVKAETGLTQEKLALAMGFTTQSAVSHYLNGINPMSALVVLRFAHHLGCDPNEIRPAFYESLPLPDGVEGVSSESADFARRLDRLPPEDQELLFLQLERLEK